MFGSNLGSEVNCKLRSAENVVEEKNTTNSNQFHAQLLISALIFPRLQIIRFASLAYLHSTLNAFPLFSLERQRFLCVCTWVRARERKSTSICVCTAQHTDTHTRARLATHVRAPILLSLCVFVVHVWKLECIRWWSCCCARPFTQVYFHTHKHSDRHTHTSVSSVCNCVWEKHEKSIRRLRWCWCCTLENIIGVKGAEEEKKCEANGRKKLSIAFSHTQTSVQTKNRVE